MNLHQKYMHRCIQLAKLGSGSTSPNPLVGAVLVYNHQIIGEGYHKQYGEPHAEVNCIKSVHPQHLHLIAQSTLYVSLEPCCHYGKTPPCTNIILQYGIKKVVIGCKDMFGKVNGEGINILRSNGVEVIEDVLQQASLKLNQSFLHSVSTQSPLITLKWAQTANAFIDDDTEYRLLISNSISNIWVDKLRYAQDAILVGKHTAIKDNPNLLCKHFYQPNTIRIVIDQNLEIPTTHNLYNNKATTIFINNIKNEVKENCVFIKTNQQQSFIQQLNTICTQYHIQSLLVEGGATTLQYFINHHYWHKAFVITNKNLVVKNGIKAPTLTQFKIENNFKFKNDLIEEFSYEQNQ